MLECFLIGGTCGLGCLVRYVFSFANDKASIPIGTLLANLLAAFLIGFFWDKVHNQELYRVLSAGFLGGLGTYSTLNDELLHLLKTPKRFVSYLCLTYGLGIAMVYFGLLI